jgi:hypothetical protein
MIPSPSPSPPPQVESTRPMSTRKSSGACVPVCLCNFELVCLISGIQGGCTKFLVLSGRFLLSVIPRSLGSVAGASWSTGITRWCSWVGAWMPTPKHRIGSFGTRTGHNGASTVIFMPTPLPAFGLVRLLEFLDCGEVELDVNLELIMKVCKARAHALVLASYSSNSKPILRRRVPVTG